MHFRDLPIKQKLVGMILLTTLPVILLTGLVLVAYELQQYKEITTRNLTSVARILAANSTAILIFDDEKLAEEILSGLKAEAEVSAAALYDSAGKVYAVYPPHLPVASFPTEISTERVMWSKNAIKIFEPVIQGSKRVGTLYLQGDLSTMYERSRVYILTILATVLGAGLVALLLSNLSQRLVSQPILDLAELAKVVSEKKDYSVRAPPRGADELGFLNNSFNLMLDQIQQSLVALRESEARFRTLAEAAPNMVWVANPGGEAEYFNRPWYDYTGLDFEKSAGHRWAEAVHSEDRASYLEHWQHAVDQRLPFEQEVRFRAADGSYRWFLNRALPLRDVNGKVLKWFGTGTDIQGRKQTEQALQEAQRKLTEHAQDLEGRVAERTARLTETVAELESFSYSISHDMKAPLRSMQGYADIVLSDYGDKIGDEGKEYLNRIIRAARRQDALIQDILIYSRVAREDLNLDPVNLGTLVDDVIQQYPDFLEPKATVQVQRPLLKVMGHEASLSQVMSNLIGNAIKFVRPNEKPRVRIWSEPVGAEVRVWVEDNGIGIAERDLKRIFGIFERFHTDQAYEGTGIGLSIVRKAIERMGGKVGVESEVGKGTRFWFMLKRA